MNFFKKISLIIFIISLFFIQLNTNNDKFFYPTDYKEISSNYGNRNIFGNTYFHNGIDFLAPQNSKVYACYSGIVKNTGFSTSYGNYIIIQHSNGYSSLYGHLSEFFLVNIGDYIEAKQYIGSVGSKYLSNGKLNGITTGPHLHFTIFDEKNNTINPLEILKEDSNL